jgi:LysM repeat protein
MSAQNPFQIPSCFKLDIEQRRRERFKKTVVTAVIISAAVVVGLLIEGCVSEKSSANVPDNSTPMPAQTAPAAPQSQSQPVISKTSVPAQPGPVATVQKKTATPVERSSSTGAAVYFVKSGDTLSHIAKMHNTTVPALKSANALANDRITVGEKLKIPSA